MALADKNIIGGKGAPYFEPKNHTNDLALIIEPKSIRHDVPNQNGARDEVLAQVTVFRSQSQLDKGEPHEVKLYTITPKVVVRDLAAVLADAKKNNDPAPAVIVTIGIWKPPNSTNKIWVLKSPNDDDYEKAADYYEKREAATQAALDDVPDF